MMRYTDLAPGHLRPRTSEPAPSNIYPGVHNTEVLDDSASDDDGTKCGRDEPEGTARLRDDDCEKEAEEEDMDDGEEEHSEIDTSDVDSLSDGYVSN